MTLQSINQRNARADTFQALKKLDELSFSQILTLFLEEKGGTRKDLLYYLWDNGFDIGQTSIDRYFNGLRFPRSEKGITFIMLFAEYLELNREEKRLLILAWELCKSGFIVVRST